MIHKIFTKPSVALVLAGLCASAQPLHADWSKLAGIKINENWPWLTRVEPSSTMPTINFSEKPKEYIFVAELPGMRKEDVSVTIESGLLTVSGERKVSNEEKDANYRIQESFYGQFSRSLTLPRDADPNQVKAEFKEGVLTLTIGRNEALQPKKIIIK